MLSQFQQQQNLFADPGDSEIVMFEATSRLTGFQGNQVWIGANGASNDWGSCNVFVSADGTTYKQVGSIDVRARLGTLDSTFASGADPDTSHSLVVDMAPNTGQLEAGTTTDADLGNTLCFVEGEIVAYSAAAVTGPGQYTLDTYLRRGQMGSTITSHSAGGLFLRLDDAVFKYTYDPTWAGKTLHFKFQSVNSFNNAAQDISTLTAVSFTVPGANPGTVDASSGLVLKKQPRPVSIKIPRFPAVGVGHLGWTPADTAPFLVGKGTGISGTPASLNTTGATLLVALLGTDVASTPVTLTDSYGNTWNYLTEQVVGTGNVRMRIAYAYNPTVGTGHTFTIDGSHPFAAELVYAFGNTALTAGVFDSENGINTVTTSPFQPGSVSPVEGDIVVTGFFTNGGDPSPCTIDSGFSSLDKVINFTTGFGAYRLSASGSVDPTITALGAITGSACIACFKGA